MKGSGRFLALCSVRPTAVLFDGKPIDFSHGEAHDGVPFLEAGLPKGYTGETRSLVVQWEREGGGGVNGQHQGRINGPASR